MAAQDLEEIRKALGEEELTGYLVSYGDGDWTDLCGNVPR